MKSISAAVIACLLLTVLSLAQTPQGQQPSPPQQVLLMGYFVGDWTLEGTTKINPKTPGTPFHATEHSEWVPGGYFMETKKVMHGPLGDLHSVRMMEWVPQDKAYTYNEYNSLGEHVLAIGTANGNTWVWNSEKKLNGVVTKGRYIITLTSPAAYTFKSETEKPGGGWVTITEGKATRVQQQEQ